MEVGPLKWIIALLMTASVCHQVASQEDCQQTWLTHYGYNIVGGSYDPSAKTVLACKSTCLRQAGTGCIGFDFDGSSSCWITFSGNLTKDTGSRVTVTHYTLLRNVNSCTSNCTNGNALTWNVLQDKNVAGGASTSDKTLPDCIKSCTNNAQCVGFDWDTKSETQCWLSTNINAQKQNATGVVHYEKECTSFGTRIVTPAFIPPNQSKSSVFSTIPPTEGTNKSTTQGFVRPTNLTTQGFVRLTPLTTQGPSTGSTTQGPNTGSITLTAEESIGSNTSSTIPTVTSLAPGISGDLTDRPAEDSLHVVYIQGQAIKPAYIVIAGLGGGCILLVIIAVIVLCVYPLRGDNDGGYGKQKKQKKQKNEKGELHTRRPKTLSEEEHIGMSTTTTAVHRTSYDGDTINNTKSNGNAAYNQRDSGHDYNQKESEFNNRNSGDDYNNRDSGHDQNRRNSVDSIRKSGGFEEMDSHGDRESILDKAKDRVRSMTDSVNDNGSYMRDD